MTKATALSTAPPRKDADADRKGPRRSGPGHYVALVRSLIYSVSATLFFIAMSLACLWIMLFPANRMRIFLRLWASGDLLLLRLICGQTVEVRGTENIPTGPALVAAKHQAAWETMALVPMLPRGVIILKKELLKIPLYGNYASFFGMIPVDRSAGSAALKKLAEDSRAAVDKGMQILIFPEGTRRVVDAPPDYKPGAIFLYNQLKVPLVPVALNSGLLWPRRRLVRYPGTISVSFLPAIPPGLSRAEAQERLQTAIERETDRLVAEGRQRQAGR